MSRDTQRRVLVTGATGKIGRHVVNELLERGYHVRALTSKPVAESASRVRLEWRRLDFQESLNFDPVLQGCVAVIHLAAEITGIERMQRSNVAATRALAEASERASIRFFCYTSSVSAYGSSRRRLVAEDSPVLTSDHDVPGEYWGSESLRCYGRTKLQGELAIRDAARNAEYVILRPTVVVDVPDLIKLGDWTMSRKRRLGAGHAHHIYVRDVADAIVWFMERSLGREQPSPGVETFNLSEDDTPISSYGEFFKSTYEATSDARWAAPPMPWPVEWLYAIYSSRRLILRHPFGRVVFSNHKLRETGYVFRFGMSRAIADFHRELESARSDNQPPRVPGDETVTA
jgi:nucleoside-diphosphate-sugar epimerase